MTSLAIGRVDGLSAQDQVARHLSTDLLAHKPASARAASWLAGRVLLSRLLRRGPLPVLPLDPLGKPLPADADMPGFSISHSGDHVLVLVGPDARPVGCDVERIRTRRGLMSIAQTYFSPSEVEWLWNMKDGEARTVGFWKLWTLREAILKQQSRSVWEMGRIALQPYLPYTENHFVKHWRWGGLSVACCLASPVEITIETGFLELEEEWI
jgi:4'-phosphopantetheinyl transferase